MARYIIYLKSLSKDNFPSGSTTISGYLDEVNSSWSIFKREVFFNNDCIARFDAADNLTSEVQDFHHDILWAIQFQTNSEVSVSWVRVDY